MYFLPKMGPEDLNQGDLKRGDLSMQEDAGQIQLHWRNVSTMKKVVNVDLRSLALKSHVDVCAINRRGPPQREPSVR